MDKTGRTDGYKGGPLSIFFGAAQWYVHPLRPHWLCPCFWTLDIIHQQLVQRVGAPNIFFVQQIYLGLFPGISDHLFTE